VSDRKSQIANIATQLQQQRDVPTWAVASLTTIEAIVDEKAEQYGPRSQWFLWLFRLLGVTRLSRVALLLIGMITTTIWWCRCKRASRHPITPSVIFVGFGAGCEPEMIAELQAEFPKQVAAINESVYESFAAIAVPSLLDLYKVCCVESRLLIKTLQLTRLPLLQKYRKAWLVGAAIRFPDYVFAKAWVEALPDKTNRIIIISASAVAFGITDAERDRCEIEYRQHGLHRSALVFPAFNCVRTLNELEARHLAARLPRAIVSAVRRYTPRITTNEPTLLFVSAFDGATFSKRHYLDILQGIFEWADRCGINVVVRPHPAEDDSFWREHFPSLARDQLGRTFYASIRALKPRFVFGWWSTCLIEALEAGVIPVLILTGSTAALEGMVYPLEVATITWESNEQTLADLAQSPTRYQKKIASLQAFTRIRSSS